MSAATKRLQDWYSRNLLPALTIIIVELLMVIWQFTNGNAFEWRTFSPIDQPDIFERALYSALAYISLGWVLYRLHFYQFLSRYFGNDRQGYNHTKRGVWGLLLAFMYLVIVPWAVDMLNELLSLLFNLWMLVLYISPATFAATLMIFMAIILKSVRSDFLANDNKVKW